MVGHGLSIAGADGLAEDGELRVQELATIAIGAEASLMKLHAGLSLKVRWDMLLLDEFMSPMREGAGLLEVAGACDLPVPAHLRLQLRLILLNELITVSLRCELLFRALDCSQVLVGSPIG